MGFTPVEVRPLSSPPLLTLLIFGAAAPDNVLHYRFPSADYAPKIRVLAHDGHLSIEFIKLIKARGVLINLAQPRLPAAGDAVRKTWP